MPHFWIIITSVLVGINCALLGTFLVVRNEAMIGEAIAHAVLPGIVIAFLVTRSTHPIYLFTGALFTSLLATATIVALQYHVGLTKDSALNLVLTTFFALGIILISMFTHKLDIDPDCVFNGEIVYIPFDTYTYAQGLSMPPTVMQLICLTLFNGLCSYHAYRIFRLISFDTTFARTIGIQTHYWYYGLMGLTTMTTVISFRIVGSILVVAMLIIPAASAYLLVQHLSTMSLLAMWIGILVAIGGCALATLININVPGAMVSIASLLFGMAWLAKRQ